MNLIPMPKKIEKQEGILNNKSLNLISNITDDRLINAINKLPLSDNGTAFEIVIEDNNKESYTIKIDPETVLVKADSPAGAFYAIQTLRQLLENDEVPCCYIKDEPDFGYRGFYHDVTRGKVPTVETLKRLIDDMAYYKLNSLQLYVEHTFAFREYADSIERTGYLTADEIKELDEYCRMNFIEFIPSLASFGHLYELLQKDKYKHLREIEGYEAKEFYWNDRMAHHTVDPTSDESFELITSLIDQYMENFTSNKFNICCDETFDLKVGKHKDQDTGKLYIDFVLKLINYLVGKGKTVMMWADILLNYPEQIKNIPENVELLNWDYWENPKEETFRILQQSGRTQIVCPGTNTWNRFCENYNTEVINITKMVDYGRKYGAEGVLNTNWGDWGNPCSIELAMYGLVFGAEKSWNAEATVNETYNTRVDSVLYKEEKACEIIKRLSAAHKATCWYNFARYYSTMICDEEYEVVFPKKEELIDTVTECFNIIADVKNWANERYKKQIILAAEGIAVMAEILSIHAGYETERITDTEEWLKKYREAWVADNKESELREIEKMFRIMDKK